MKTNTKYLFLVIAALFTTGCAIHMSQQECAAANWEQIGFNDGLAGSMPKNLSSATEDCAKFGIVVNQNIYRKGWDSGVRRYCSYDQGFTIGTQGQPAPTICPPDLQGKFMQGWKKGLQNYCNYDQGYSIGSQAQPAPAMCPTDPQTKFMQGWRNGLQNYCSNSSNAYTLGRNGQAFPGLCSPVEFAQSKMQYDRGLDIFNQLQALHNRLDDLHYRVQRKADMFHLVQVSEDYFDLGPDHSPQAHEAMDRVNDMGHEARDLRRQISYLEMQN